MRLATGGEPAPAIWQHCYPAFPETPSVRSTACHVPPVARLAVGPGVAAATAETRSALWAATEWELHIDGRRVDLAAFGTSDADLEPPLAKWRGWDVLLEKPAVGSHTLRAVLVRKEAMSDGLRTVPPGRYELVVNFTLGQ
jgi:hypothetical protein